MKVYIITFVLVTILCKLGEDSAKIDFPKSKYLKKHENIGWRYMFLAGVVLVFVAGFRYRVGADYGAYYGVYTGNINDVFHQLLTLDEPGYSLIAWLASRLFYDGAAPLFLASLITITLALIVIFQNTDQLLFSTILYLTLGCWHGSFNGVRQYLAASIVFCGLSSLKDRHFFKYCFFIFLAFLCHRSALIMLPVYFIIRRSISVRNIFIYLVTVIITLRFFDYLFTIAGWIMDKNYSLDDQYASTQVNRIRVIAACIPAILFLVIYLGKELNEIDTLYLNITILHVIFCVATRNSALLYRIGIYTAPFQTIAIPELMKGIFGYTRKLITFGILILYISMWLYEVSTYGTLNDFQWIWER